MSWLLYIVITLLTFILMEGFTQLAALAYVMHGVGWYLHKDHHQKGRVFFSERMMPISSYLPYQAGCSSCLV